MFDATITNGKLSMNSGPRYEALMENTPDGEYVVEIKRKRKKRTDQQNRALHLYFNKYAEEAAQAGLTVGLFYSEAKVPWSPEVVKEMWRTIQKHLFGITSTTQITTNEMNDIYDVMNQIMVSMGGPHIPFPSIEELYATSS